jgi:hypothetical protein
MLHAFSLQENRNEGFCKNESALLLLLSLFICLILIDLHVLVRKSRHPCCQFQLQIWSFNLRSVCASTLTVSDDLDTWTFGLIVKMWLSWIVYELFLLIRLCTILFSFLLHVP